jgi:hypothetical protein
MVPSSVGQAGRASDRGALAIVPSPPRTPTPQFVALALALAHTNQRKGLHSHMMLLRT